MWPEACPVVCSPSPSSRAFLSVLVARSFTVPPLPALAVRPLSRLVAADLVFLWPSPSAPLACCRVLSAPVLSFVFPCAAPFCLSMGSAWLSLGCPDMVSASLHARVCFSLAFHHTPFFSGSLRIALLRICSPLLRRFGTVAVPRAFLTL